MSEDGSRTRVHLVRHAAAAAWSVGHCIGRTDVPLSQAGRERADQLAASFAGLQLDAVYSSPALRARDTARPVAVVAHRGVSVVEGLAEIDFGSFDGRPFDEIAKSEPARYQEWMTDPTRVTFPGGESYADLQTRVTASIREVVQRHRGATVVVVTHAGPIRAVLAGVLEMPDRTLFRLDVAPGTVTVVDWIGDAPIVRGVGTAQMTFKPLATRRPAS